MNIVITGLAGSGKSSLGQMVAERLGMTFVDIDAMIESLEGRSITDIFAQDGEEYFRDVETACALKSSQIENAVLSTGGGMILREENMVALRKTGLCFFIDRAPEYILKNVDLSGRPLLADDFRKIFDQRRNRIHLYTKYADLIVKNDEDQLGSVEQIISYYLARTGAADAVPSARASVEGAEEPAL
jgi:shikimate kinase